MALQRVGLRHDHRSHSDHEFCKTAGRAFMQDFDHGSVHEPVMNHHGFGTGAVRTITHRSQKQSRHPFTFPTAPLGAGERTKRRSASQSNLRGADRTGARWHASVMSVDPDDLGESCDEECGKHPGDELKNPPGHCHQLPKRINGVDMTIIWCGLLDQRKSNTKA